MRRWISRAIEWLGGHELGVLVGSTCVVAAAWAFFAIAGQVSRGATRSFDDRLLLALRVPGELGRPIGPEWMPEVARDITSLGSTDVLVLATIAVAGFLALDRRYSAMVFVLVATGGGWGVAAGAKLVFNRPRPDLVPHLMRAYFSSFPSGHSMMSAIVYGTLGSLLASLVKHRRLKFYFLSLAAVVAGLVGVSRVYLGVHYPTDVLAGWSAGLAWSTLCWLVERALKRSGTIEPSV